MLVEWQHESFNVIQCRGNAVADALEARNGTRLMFATAWWMVVEAWLLAELELVQMKLGATVEVARNDRVMMRLGMKRE